MARNDYLPNPVRSIPTENIIRSQPILCKQIKSMNGRISAINEHFSKNKKSTPKQADTYSNKALMQLDYNITE